MRTSVVCWITLLFVAGCGLQQEPSTDTTWEEVRQRVAALEEEEEEEVEIPGSLRLAILEDGGVPTPSRLGEVVRNQAAAIALGKALFWWR